MEVADVPGLIFSNNRAEMSPLKEGNSLFGGAFTGGRPSVPKLPGSRSHFLLPNQQEVAHRPISTRNWETAACKSPVLNNTFRRDSREMIYEIWVCLCEYLQKMRNVLGECVCRKLENSSPPKKNTFLSLISVIIPNLYDVRCWYSMGMRAGYWDKFHNSIRFRFTSLQFDSI